MTEKKKRPVSLNPSAAVSPALADLCFEDALKIGARKSEALKPHDFKETSFRFCVDGLRDWYSAFVDDYCGGSLYTVIRDISWHWASFCETDSTLVELRESFGKLRREITQETSYTDLIERMQQPTYIKEFSRTQYRPFSISLPTEVVGVVGRGGSALGIPFSKFIQVGLAWSLSTNNQGLYPEWSARVFKPLFESVMVLAKQKVIDLAEVRVTLDYRRQNGKQ